MTLKSISYNQFKEAVRISFSNDKDIKTFYDKNVFVNTVDDIVEDISKKVAEYANYNGNLFLKGVFDEERLIGYVVRFNNLLISFSISYEYRTKEKTREFFRLIKDDFNEVFFCYLWSINLRARRWLEKMGMETIFSDNNIIKLKCL
jgi:hypothetical protein